MSTTAEPKYSSIAICSVLGIHRPEGCTTCLISSTDLLLVRGLSLTKLLRWLLKLLSRRSLTRFTLLDKHAQTTSFAQFFWAILCPIIAASMVEAFCRTTGAGPIGSVQCGVA